jgi:hypothetical protein
MMTLSSRFAKQLAANNWIVTGYEVDPGRTVSGRATTDPTSSAASRTRDGEGAGSDGSLSRLSVASNPTASERADKIIQNNAATAKPVDAMARTLTRITGIERMTSAIYNRAATLLDNFTPENVKAGMVSDYGEPEAVIDQRAAVQGRQREACRWEGGRFRRGFLNIQKPLPPISINPHRQSSHD